MSSSLCLFILLHDFLMDLFTSASEILFLLYGNQGGREYVIFTEFHAIISPTQQNLRSNLIEEIKIISYSIEPVTVFATYSPAHSGSVDNEEADRLAKHGYS